RICPVRGVIAELIVLVVAPAFDPTTARERAGVDVARGDLYDSAGQARDVDGIRGGPVVRSAVAELPAEIPAPAFHTSAARDCAGVVIAGGDRGNAARE